MGKETFVQWPFGKADIQAPESAATYAVTVTNRKTFLNLAPAAAGLVNIAADEHLAVGAELVIKVTQGGTGRNITFGSDNDTIVAPALTGVANDVDTISLEWDGTAWTARTVWQKIVDAA